MISEILTNQPEEYVCKQECGFCCKYERSDEALVYELLLADGGLVDLALAPQVLVTCQLAQAAGSFKEDRRLESLG